MNSRNHSKRIWISLAVLAALLLCLGRPSSSGKVPPLSSTSAAYWRTFSNSVTRLSPVAVFPDGWPVETEFGEWLVSTTNRPARERAVVSILEIDRADCLPFLAWMESAHPDWTRERIGVFIGISATVPYWATNSPPRWTDAEQKEFAAFFRSRFDSETHWRCRLSMDSFFLRTEPDWKTSEERLRFLKQSLRMKPPDSTTNEFLRRIEKRFESVDVDAYERLQRKIVH